MSVPAGTPWTDLGAGVHVRQSRAYAMNSLLLLDPRHTVIVDPGVLPSELEDIAAVAREIRPAQVTLLFSHAHWDHVLGRPWWPGAATLAHPRFAAEVRATEASIGREAGRLAALHGEALPGPFRAFEPDLEAGGGRVLELGPWTLALRDAPGHSASQVIAHLPARRLLFAADMLSDIEIPILDGPCAVYRRTLAALFPLFEAGEVEVLVPGHGAVARGVAECGARLLRDTLYLIQLEDEVRRARAGGLGLEDAQRALEAMDYPGRRAGDPMQAIHRDNVRFAYQGLAGC